MPANTIRLPLSIEGAYLELIQPEHIDSLYALFESNREYLRRNIPGVDATRTREDLQRRWGTPRENALPFGLWLNAERLIGRCRLTRHVENGSVDVGYWLDEAYQGRGLMTAAVEQLTKFAFEQWNAPRVEIHCGESNSKSRSIPERLGFVNEGVAPDDQPVEVNGQMIRSVVYVKRRDTDDQ